MKFKMAEQTYILRIAYDGTDYFGWQKQLDVPTIQGILEMNLSKLFDIAIKTTGASRTDSGVHAIDQSVSFQAEPKYPADDLLRRLNRMLPDDIAVLDTKLISEKFHARYDAKGKRYRYSILTGKNPLEMRYACWLPNVSLSQNELPILNALSEKIIGTHDFSAFSILKSLPDKPLCTIFKAEWQYANHKSQFTNHESQIMLSFVIEGNRFLHKMIRSLVGAMISVASGKMKKDDFIKMLESGQRIVEYRIAPPHGLLLEKVFYEESEIKCSQD